MRAISCATCGEAIAWTKSTAERKNADCGKDGPGVGVWTFELVYAVSEGSSSKAAAPSAKRIRLSEL